MMTTISPTCDLSQPSAREVGGFLAQYASWMTGCGATCIRIEKNVNRIAHVYGKRAELTILPRHVQMSVFDEGDEMECLTVNTAVKNTPISFALNTRLSELSWKIADRNLDLDEARRLFDKIVSTDYGMNPVLLLILVACANASFCRLFGGDGVAMVVVGIATLAGFWLKNFLLRRHVDVRAVFVICSFVSAVLGCSDILFSVGSTPKIALATSVLYLVPGIPFLNSFSDMLYHHYICAFSRFMNAVILTCCLSIGLCLGMLVMNVGMF